MTLKRMAFITRTILSNSRFLFYMLFLSCSSEFAALHFVIQPNVFLLNVVAP